MTEDRLSLGRWGEQQAARYLRRRLYRIVATNYRCRHGEIDLIAQRGKTLAFVEVKTRRGRCFGAPQEAVTPRKQQQIIATANHYLMTQQPSMQTLRFDVIAVDVDGERTQIDHIVDAFEAS